MNFGQLQQNLQVIEQIINSYQSVGQVTSLIAVTKTVDAATIDGLYRLGHRHFGENRPKILLEKQEILKDLKHAVWHFIGNLQTRQVRTIINHIDYLHSLDRESLAKEIQKRANKVINCFVQVNVSGEVSKSGISPDRVVEWIKELKQYDKIRIVGLMTMAPEDASDLEIQGYFQQLKVLQEEVASYEWVHAPCTETSMGMSGDYELAVAAGASFVRVGTALFEGVSDNCPILYMAYGSNLNQTTIQTYCPDAVFYKKTFLDGYQLQFKGIAGRAYATIEKNAESSIPVIIWMIPSGNISGLDEYEDYPDLYDRIYLDLEGQQVMTYQMLSEYQIAEPEVSYYQSIREIYIRNSWPIEALDHAFQQSQQSNL